MAQRALAWQVPPPERPARRRVRKPPAPPPKLLVRAPPKAVAAKKTKNDVGERREGARVADLCEEDRKKIGSLIRKIIVLRNENESQTKAFNSERENHMKQLARLNSQNREIIAHTINIRERFHSSLSLLRAYKERLRSACELQKTQLQTHQKNAEQQEQLQDEINRLREALEVHEHLLIEMKQSKISSEKLELEPAEPAQAPAEQIRSSSAILEDSDDESIISASSKRLQRLLDIQDSHFAHSPKSVQAPVPVEQHRSLSPVVPAGRLRDQHRSLSPAGRLPEQHRSLSPIASADHLPEQHRSLSEPQSVASGSYYSPSHSPSSAASIASSLSEAAEDTAYCSPDDELVSQFSHSSGLTAEEERLIVQLNSGDRGQAPFSNELFEVVSFLERGEGDDDHASLKEDGEVDLQFLEAFALSSVN